MYQNYVFEVLEKVILILFILYISTTSNTFRIKKQKFINEQ